MAGLIPLAVLAAVAVLVVETLIKNRLSSQYALLWLLTVATERGVPLVPAVEALARERGGLFSGRVRHLADLLRAGVPLPEAVGQMPGLLPHAALPMIRVGYESGALAAALRQAASASDSQRPLWLAMAGRLLYLMVVVMFGFAVITFMMYKIVPSFNEIFSDFDLPLPWLTELVVFASHLVAVWWFLLFPFFLLFGLLMVYFFLRYAGLVHFDLPGTAWLARRLDAAAVLETLAVAAEYGRPLPEAIASLAQTYHKASIRARLHRVLADVDAGADWCESLLLNGLIGRADRGILQAAQRAGNLPWALKEMAESSRRRLAYRLYVAVQLMFPPCVLMIGAAVLFVVVGLFIPLIALTQSLT